MSGAVILHPDEHLGSHDPFQHLHTGHQPRTSVTTTSPHRYRDTGMGTAPLSRDTAKPHTTKLAPAHCKPFFPPQCLQLGVLWEALLSTGTKQLLELGLRQNNNNKKYLKKTKTKKKHRLLGLDPGELTLAERPTDGETDRAEAKNEQQSWRICKVVVSVHCRQKISAEAAPRHHSLLPFCLSSLCALL